MRPRIDKAEFLTRISRIQEKLEERNLNGLMVYGDEYRKENLRYVSNFWPIFERGACFIPAEGEPILAGAPEGEPYAREMTVWNDLRNIKEFACVTVPEEIDFPHANFSTLKDIIHTSLGGGKRLGIVGMGDIPAQVMDRVKKASDGLEIVDSDSILTDLRLIKTEAEIECLREAGRIACIGYEKLMANAIPGNTELQASGAGEGASRMAGAEDINFMVMGTGPRTATVIGRPINRIMLDGDMVMAAMAVQYEGYVSTVEFPFVVGSTSVKQKDFLNILFEAANIQQEYLKNGAISGEMVKAVKAVFSKYKVSDFDVYPPMHGIGLAEAESPYPDADATYELQSGMCVNSDISLFGHPDGSNRIEEGFIITDSGPDTITPLIRALCEKGV